jgi:phage terminase large subunit-like protein
LKPSAANPPTLAKFKVFCGVVGLRLEPFQEQIVEALFQPRRETLVLLPRGNGKTTLLAALALYHLISTPQAKVAIGAASREQAGVLFEIARNMASIPPVNKGIEITRREIRYGERWIKVVSSDGPKQHGLVLSLAIIDELHAHHDDELYIALRTGMMKVAGAQIWTISTAGISDDSALGSLRVRARQAPDVQREGPFTRAVGPNLGMLEWSLPEDADVEDMSQVKSVNPASWLTPEALAEQREAVHDIAFRRYHANQWVAAKAPWIMGDVWDANGEDPEIPEPSEVVLGVDASIRHDSTCVATVRRDPDGIYHATFRVWNPERGQEVQMQDVMDFIRAVGERHDVRAVVYDPQFMHHAAQQLEGEGMAMLEWRQDNARMVPATRTLHEAVVHGKLRHGGDATARKHALAAEVWETERGIRLKKTASKGHIDCLVALAMAVEWASRQEERPVSVYESRSLLNV